MEVTFKELGFMLKPHSSGLCWEMLEWKPEREWQGKKVDADWVPTGKYPSTLSNGVKHVMDAAELSLEDKVDLQGAINKLEFIKECVLAEIGDEARVLPNR